MVVSAFYELEKSKIRIPHLYRLKDNSILGFAGLYERWKSPAGDVWSYTIITNDANELVEKTHPRMPAIIHPSEYNFWLDPENHNTDELSGILKPYSASEMTYNKVSTDLNDTKNDYPELLNDII